MLFDVIFIVLLFLVLPGVERLVDYPLPGFTVFYTLQAVDNELPSHDGVLSDSFECFQGYFVNALIPSTSEDYCLQIRYINQIGNFQSNS